MAIKSNMTAVMAMKRRRASSEVQRGDRKRALGVYRLPWTANMGADGARIRPGDRRKMAMPPQYRGRRLI